MKTAQTIHCFLIDDDPEEIEIFHLALEELDFSVKCSSHTNCHDALRMLIREDEIPDCIFLDLYMGPTSGKECLNTIISTEIISQIPVVILSGSSNEPKTDELKKLGAQEFIVKSNTIEGLAKQLNHYFKSHFNTDNDLAI